MKWRHNVTNVHQ